MAPRDPGRPKASDLSDEEALEACRIYGEHNGVHPWDAHTLAGLRLPAKVVAAKYAKLRTRGLVDNHDRLTKAGYDELARLQQEEAS